MDKNIAKNMMCTAYALAAGLLPSKPLSARKIFVLSLHRSATTSTHQLLVQSGFSSIHWPNKIRAYKVQGGYSGFENDHDAIFRQLRYHLKRYDALSDVPVPVLYRPALRNYPDARFILVTRKPEDWVQSVRRHVGNRALHPAERVQYWTYFQDNPQDLNAISNGQLEQVYGTHTQTVKSYFAEQGKRDQLICVDTQDLKCGQKIGEFLGVGNQVLMPHANGAGTLKSRKTIPSRVRNPTQYIAT